MKRIFNICLTITFSLLLITACSPDEYKLGTVDVSSDDLVEGFAYTIEHDAENPNIVYLTSLMDSKYTPLWSHPQGRSQKEKVTLKIPFAGDYNVVFGVQTRGGQVFGDTAHFTVDNIYPEFIENELWSFLAGGIGESRTWYLDLDADGVSRYFAGPLYFYGTDNGWLGDCYGDDCWNWNPDYAGNSWLMDAVDFGSMTFNLIDGAFVEVDHTSLGRHEEGTYMLDTDEHVLQMTDAGPLHDTGRDGQVIDWGYLKIISLTDSTMQLGALRDEALSGEGACLLVYNYISKEYRDGWVAEEVPDPEPELPDGWADDVSSVTSYSVKWALSPETPFNWANLDGSLMNTWNGVADYPDWSGMTADVPATYENFSMTLNSQNMTVEMILPNGSSSSGSYTLDEKGIYTFDGVTPYFNICGDINLATTAENQWRILSLVKDAAGDVTGMWVGALSTEKPEYTAYLLVPQVAGGEVDPKEAWLTAFDGKTFVPDVNWFVDWVGDAPGFSGGWTSSSTFGEDYTSNTWVWTEQTRTIAESASISFARNGSDLTIDLAQSLTTEHNDGTDEAPNWVVDSVDDTYTNTGTVAIDTENAILAIDIPLINYSGSPARWLSTTGNDDTNWYFVSHGGSSLSNIDSEGFWLGYTSKEGETTIYHFVLKE